MDKVKRLLLQFIPSKEKTTEYLLVKFWGTIGKMMAESSGYIRSACRNAKGQPRKIMELNTAVF